jgi:hypothetical protein
VGRSQHSCSVSGKVFSEGEEFYSALKEEGETFVRVDYSPECWDELEKKDFFSFWRTKLQKSDGKKKNRLVIDVEAFYTFFRSLENEQKESRKLFRYLIALILVRKRVLRLDEIEKSPDGEALILFDSRQKQECSVSVCAASEEALVAAQEELNQIFACGDITAEE